LDALRLLIGRGGNPDKTDQFGNSALHLAAAKGHFACVDFLVKFGANLFLVDIDSHTACQLSAINNREDILRYLDAAAAHLETTDKKKANALKEKAKKQSEKRIKEFMKKQQKSEDESEKTNRFKTLRYKFWSGSTGNLSKLSDQSALYNQETKFSDLVGSSTMIPTRGAAERRIQQIKMKSKANANQNGDLSDIVGTRNSLPKGSIARRDPNNEVLYVGTFQNANTEKRGRIADVFVDYESSISGSVNEDRKSLRHAALTRCLSQPDLLASNSSDSIGDDIRNQRPSGLFERPCLGALSIPQSLAYATDQMSNHSSSESGSTKKTNSKKVRSRTLVITDSEESDESSQDSGDESSDDCNQALKRFLAAYSLEEHYELLLSHKIDLDTLMILTEDDLKSLNLRIGPYRKLVVAIQERKNALHNPGAIIDSRL
jgi:hypothetical protein